MRRTSAPSMSARRLASARRTSASLFCGRSISSASAALGVRTPSSTACICCGDRQLDAVSGAELERGLRRAHAFGDHALPAQHVVERAAAPELDADLTVAAAMAGAGEHEIAEPAQAGQRVGAAAHRRRQARDLDEAAGDERGHRVVAEAEALDDAGGNRHDVLQRAADLDAGDVVGGVEPQRRPAELAPGRARAASARRGRHRRPRSAGRPRPRRRTSGPTAPPPARSRPGFVGDHLRHPVERAVLEPLGRADERHRPRRDRDGAMDHRAQALRRHGDDDQRGAGDGLLDRGGRRARRRA